MTRRQDNRSQIRCGFRPSSQRLSVAADRCGARDNDVFLGQPESRGWNETAHERTCPQCGSHALVCRPVLDETIARMRCDDYEPEHDLWFHFACCDRCRIAWLAGASRGLDLGVIESERNNH